MFPCEGGGSGYHLWPELAVRGRVGVDIGEGLALVPHNLAVLDPESLLLRGLQGAHGWLGLV